MRTIVEVETADGYVGLGEMGGGGEDATRAFTGLLSYLDGHDVFALEALRLKICRPSSLMVQLSYPKKTSRSPAAAVAACSARPSSISRLAVAGSFLATAMPELSRSVPAGSSKDKLGSGS